MAPVSKKKRNRTPHFIKEWREHRGLTQQQAADRIDMSRENYGRIENNKVPYNQDFMEMAAIAFDCTIVDLLIRNPMDESSPWTLMESVAKAPPASRKQILAVLETLLKQAS